MNLTAFKSNIIHALIVLCILTIVSCSSHNLELKQPSKQTINNTLKSFYGVIVYHDKSQTLGSAFAINHQGVLLTAGHVAHKVGNQVQLRNHNNDLIKGKVIAVSKHPDLALIKIKPFTAPVNMSTSTPVENGLNIFSIGSLNFNRPTIRIGEIKAINFSRSPHYDGFGFDNGIEVNLNTLKGESGGPLFNTSGELVGMMVSAISKEFSFSPRAHAIALPSLMDFVCTHIRCESSMKNIKIDQP